MPASLPETFTLNERRAAWSLAAIFALRMLGLFIVLPVFSLYAHQLEGATPFLIGLAAGIYGLTQGLLQIPFGLLSDYYTRKRIIAIGLLLFTVGSLIAASTHTMAGLLIGRALQGAGAIGGATIALVADLTRETQRTKAMAIVGMSIGFSFYLALILSTLITTWIGVPALFALTAILALIALYLLIYIVPTSEAPSQPRGIHFSALKRVLQNPELLRLNIGIFTLHLLLTALFVVLPLSMQSQLAKTAHEQTVIYLPIILLSGILATPFILRTEKKSNTHTYFVTAIALLGLAQFNLYQLPISLPTVIISLTLFFTAFTYLEAVLPAMVSKVAPPENRGAAMGIYSSTQFFGIFIGGILGGWLYHHGSPNSVFGAGAISCALWFLLTLKHPISHRAPSSPEQPSY